MIFFARKVIGLKIGKILDSEKFRKKCQTRKWMNPSSDLKLLFHAKILYVFTLLSPIVKFSQYILLRSYYLATIFFEMCWVLSTTFFTINIFPLSV